MAASICKAYVAEGALPPQSPFELRRLDDHAGGHGQRGTGRRSGHSALSSHLIHASALPVNPLTFDAGGIRVAQIYSMSYEGLHQVLTFVGRPMAKKCFLHLGFHKTASTYIQAIINLNRGDVLQPFHVVNRATQDTRNLKNALARYGRRKTHDAAEVAANECTRIAQDFEASGKDSLLLSEEALLGPMLRQRGETGLYSTLEPKMELLIRCFSPYELHFIFYTRESSAWLRSLYNQAVKQVRFAGSFEAFLDGVNREDLWVVLHRRLTAVAGGAVQFFPLEDDMKTAFGVGDSLFRFIGLNDGQLSRMVTPKGKVNISWPEALLALMRRLNASEIDDRSLAIVREVIKRNHRLFGHSVPPPDERSAAE